MASRFLAAARRWKWRLASVVCLAGAGAGAFVAWGPKNKKDAGFRINGRVPSAKEAWTSALYQTLRVHLTPGHHVKLLENGAVFDVLVEQVGQARSSVHVLVYIWEKGAASDRIVAALVAQARRGVRCRVLVDDVGSPDFAETIQPALGAAGCEVRIFRPLNGSEKLARNHRKLLVVDGHAAITGGFGIRDNWLGDGKSPKAWRDTSVLFTGPSVAEAQQAFAENWQEAGGELLPLDAFPEPGGSGPASAAFVASSAGVVTRAERLLQLLIASAERRIWIANAYFAPSPGIRELLGRKAREGVDVRLLLPDENSDSKTAFASQKLELGPLRAQGVRVWEYTASMMHAKTLLVDDELSLVGSINLDALSLNKLEEVALLVREPALSREMSLNFEADCARSRELKER